ncbi:MAG: peptidylprolyl isomerase [Hyphomonadaceae bacterium]
MALQHRAAWPLSGVLAGVFAFLLLAGLQGCGLGRSPDTDSGSLSDPIVAATVNGRPIYVEDVRARAVQMSRLEEGEDLSANSDAFYLTLEELIQIRLFAMEAEARGLDREPDVRRQLENAREQVLASAIYDELDSRATNPEAVEQLYRRNVPRLDQGQEIHLRHIQLETREIADAAKRRLDGGERFEVLALTMSLDQQTRSDGGDLGFRAVSDLTPQVRQMVEDAHVGDVIGPVQIGDTWHLIRIDDMRERGAPSLESLRPRIIQWLRFQEIQQLHERLAADARIERLREPEIAMEPGGEATVPEDAQQAPPPAAPDASAAPGQAPGAPPFPFPMGPGGVAGQERPQTPPPAAVTAEEAPPQPAPQPQRPAAQSQQRPAPAGEVSTQTPTPPPAAPAPDADAPARDQPVQ